MVKTTDIRGASTSANVYLKLFGKGGSMKEARMLDAGRSCFERGNEDMFLFDASDVGPMQKAVVHHDDTGFSPGWHLDSMTVTNSTTGERVCPFQSLTNMTGGRRALRFVQQKYLQLIYHDHLDSDCAALSSRAACVLYNYH